MKTILITGATRGLGLALATALSTRPDTKIVLAVRDLDAGQRLATSLGPHVSAVRLDLASQESIRKFVEAWSEPLFALINNAGLQFTGAVQFSPDDVELTLAVNHLGPLQLTMGLMDHLKGGVVMGVGSGTHNPDDRLAKMFGFRGGRFSSIPALMKGKMDAKNARQAGMDRYATSKLLFMTTAVELARRYPETRFVTLDPGLMPGTGLVRTAPAPIKWAWRFVLPALVPLVPGASTPAKSASAGCQILLDETAGSGQVYDHTSQRTDALWDKIFAPAFGQDILDQSLAALA